MNTAGKISIGILAALFAAAAFLAFAPEAAEVASARDYGALSYSYMLDSPEAVASSDGQIYVLGSGGNVFRLNDGVPTPQNDESIVCVDEISAEDADKLAAVEGTVYLYGSEYVAAAATDDGIYEITDTTISLRTKESVSPVSVTGIDGKYVCAAADGNTLMIIAETDSGFSLYSVSGTTASLLSYNLTADGDITAAATAGGKFYYATDHSLYSSDKSEGYTTRGGIVSMTEAGGELYFAAKSGSIYAFDGENTRTVISGSEKISVASRRNTVAFADKGNNVVTVMRDGYTETYAVEKPEAVAVNRFGDTYASANGNIIKASDGSVLFSASEPVTDFCFDSGNITGDTAYAVTESGGFLLLSESGTVTVITDAIAAAPKTNGGAFALGDNGSVTAISADGSASDTGISLTGAYDMETDRANNIFLLGTDGIYKYAAGENGYSDGVLIAETAGLAAFDICEAEFSSDGYTVGFGDIIAVTSKGGTTAIAANPGTNMLDDKSLYTEFEKEIYGDAPNNSEYAANIAVVTTNTEIYPCPVEMPSEYNAISEGTYVILVAEYSDSGYWYAIAESKTAGSAVGYINIDAVASAEYMTDEEMSAAYGSDLRRYARDVTPIYKFPSTSAPHLVERTSIDVDGRYNEFTLAPFVKDYSDRRGNAWYRVVWQSEDGSRLDGYIPAYALSDRSGSQTEPDFNGRIHAPEGNAECYVLQNGSYVANGRTIADDTEVEIIGTYTKSEPYTHIKYIDEDGAVRECYVLTSQVRQTEAGWYQVIMFIVAAAVVVFLVILIIFLAKRRNKIQQ